MMFASKRGIALFLMLIWLLLSAGPVAYAATGKCCPVCTDHLCPMKKQPKKTMSCHENMAEQSCQLRAGACSRQLDGLVFTFLAIIPALLWFSKEHFARLISQAIRILTPIGNQNDTPPPEPCLA